MKTTQIVLEILQACNFNCPYCRDDSGKGKMIPFGTAKEIITNFKDFGITKVQLDGGEPFLYKDIFNLLDFIVESGLEPGIYTNASLMKPEIVERLKKYEKLKLAVTLHPLNPNHEIDLTFQGLKYLREAGIFPNLIMVISKPSLVYLNEIMAKISEGMYTFLLNPLVLSGRAFDNSIELLNETDKEYLKKLINDSQQKYKNITIIDNVTLPSNDLKFEKIQLNDNEEFALHVNTDGDVLPFFSADRTTAIGNVRNLKALKQKLQDPQTFIDLENYKKAMKKRMVSAEKIIHRKIMPEEIQLKKGYSI